MSLAPGRWRGAAILDVASSPCCFSGLGTPCSSAQFCFSFVARPVPCNSFSYRGSTIFRETHLRSAADAISISGIRSSVLAPCRDGDSEEIITIVIITVSPSTIHV